MRLSNNVEHKTTSDTYWRVQLVCMNLQAQSSLEAPLDYNQDQMLFMSESWFVMVFLIILGITETCSFRLFL